MFFILDESTVFSYRQDHHGLRDHKNEALAPPKVKKIIVFQFHLFSKSDKNLECYNVVRNSDDFAHPGKFDFRFSI